MVHVDDLLITGSTEAVRALSGALSEEFRFSMEKVMEKPCAFIGKELRRTEGGFVFGVPGEYIRRACEGLGIEGSRDALSWVERKRDEPIEGPEAQKKYRQSLGRLAGADRLDVRMSVVRASTHLGKACRSDLESLERVWQYLRVTEEWTQGVVGLHVEWAPGAPSGSVMVHADADRAGCTRDGRSVSGVVAWVRWGPR